MADPLNRPAGLFPHATAGRQWRWLICLVLALGTLALYWPITHNGFVNFDDEQYVTANPHVTSGLTWTNVVWAFQSGEAANWHPLTWISHMIDCELYGLKPGGHHFNNLVLHAANTILLFLLLNNMTGALWRSAFVAAFFAWHPLHVESVAWASERKDTLSTFFFLLTLMAYVRFARNRGWVAYILALVLFACGLMSKPMVVTLPFVLLLLDFWPLERFDAAQGESSLALHLRTGARLILEKLPFFVLSLAGSLTTFLVQKTGGAMWSSSWETRAENVVLAYVRYISKLCWPRDLAIVYSYPRQWPAILAAGAALILLTWTVLLLFRARQKPYLAVGWLWFVGTLVPTIGIVQVGAQSIADRYTYIPSIGFFIVVVWGACDLAKLRPAMGKFLPIAGSLALLGCIGATSIQIACWRDSERLFLHALGVTTDNYVVENCLGKVYEKMGRNDRALVLYTDAVKLEPRYPQAQFNLALCLLAYGRTNEALGHLRIAAQLEPHDPDIQYDLGIYFYQHDDPADARRGFQAALAEKPDSLPALTAMGLLLARETNSPEAIPFFEKAVRLAPNNAEAHFNLGLALLDSRQPAAAAEQFEAELRLTPAATRAHYRLAQALQRQDKLAEAVVHYREALRLTPDFPAARVALDQIAATHPELKSPP